MLKNNKTIHVFALIFISALYICINTYTINGTDDFSLVTRVIGTISLTMIAYYLITKYVSKIHMSENVKIFFVFLFLIGMAVLTVLNLGQLSNGKGYLERNSYIQIFEFRLDKYYLVSVLILFIFPVCAQFFVDLFKKTGVGPTILLGVIIFGMHVGILLSIVGVRMATIAIVTVIDLGVILYLLVSEFKVKKKYLAAVSAVVLCIAFALIPFFSSLQQSFRRYFEILPSEIRDVLYWHSRIIGINRSPKMVGSFDNYDCYSALLEPVYNWGWLPFLIILLLSIIMIVIFIIMLRTICKSKTHKIIKNVAVALSLHILLQQIMSVLIAVGSPVFIPIHGLFYQQNYRVCVYTTSGMYSDIVIITILVMMYLGVSSNILKSADAENNSEVTTDETNL